MATYLKLDFSLHYRPKLCRRTFSWKLFFCRSSWIIRVKIHILLNWHIFSLFSCRVSTNIFEAESGRRQVHVGRVCVAWSTKPRGCGLTLEVFSTWGKGTIWWRKKKKTGRVDTEPQICYVTGETKSKIHMKLCHW